MINYSVKYIGLGVALAIAATLGSCSREDIPDVPVPEAGAPEIVFSASFPQSSMSRAQVVTAFDSLQATAFYVGDLSSSATYFENEKFRKRDGGEYSAARKINCIWPETSKGGGMQFFAFYPPIDYMKAMCRDEYPLIKTPVESSDPNGDEPQEPQYVTTDPLDNYFLSVNSSSISGNKFNVGYSISRIRMAKDIATQVDFLAARNYADIPDLDADVIPDVPLRFQHELARIDVKAKVGDKSHYTFKVAGVRLGNPVMEADFVYSAIGTPEDTPASVGEWNLSSSKKGPAEYVFRKDDQLVTIGDAESLMKRGCAMMIPASVEAWQRPADPDKVALPYTTDRMYVSLLVNVTSKSNSSKIVYPYTDNLSPLSGKAMQTVKFVVDSNDVIIAKIDNAEEYELNDGEKIMEFGWAAVPLKILWTAGKSYCYTLDFSNGIGYHDPSDPDPGHPIEETGPGQIQISVDVIPWESPAYYDPDVPVPYE